MQPNKLYVEDVLHRIRHEYRHHNVAVFWLPDEVCVVRDGSERCERLMRTHGQWLIGVYHAWRVRPSDVREDLAALIGEYRAERRGVSG